MLAPVQVAPESATIAADQSADRMVSDDENDWFIRPISTLYPKDAGLALHLLTGFEERTCYRYAAGDRKTPGFFIRQMLRSEHGEQFLAALMDGSTVQWWRDWQGARDIASRYTITPK